MSIKTFSDLNLIEPLQQSIRESGYSVPTPIQAAAIPHLLEGKDLLGCAQTGTGKTAAFALPILQRLYQSKRSSQPKRTRALILTPTRELAVQIYDSFQTYGKHLKLRNTVVFGGVAHNPQIRALGAGTDILVATPGRLLDLIEQKCVSLELLEIFVLDEADRMLDMGFIKEVRRIINFLPAHRQNLFFSATMPQEIKKLSDSLLTKPVRVEVTPVSSTAEMISQSLMYVERNQKRELLKHVLKDDSLKRVIVFTRTKHGANKVVETLVKCKVSASAIHGNKSQNARQKALEDFRNGEVRVLVATDIAARGIDVDGVTHVINFEIPNVSESYVHRIGRTARAGLDGSAISFCDSEEKSFIKDIERLTKKTIQVILDHPFHSETVANSPILSKGVAKAMIEGKENDRYKRRRPRPFFGKKSFASKNNHGRNSKSN